MLWFTKHIKSKLHETYWFFTSTVKVFSWKYTSSKSTTVHYYVKVDYCETTETRRNNSNNDDMMFTWKPFWCDSWNWFFIFFFWKIFLWFKVNSKQHYLHAILAVFIPRKMKQCCIISQCKLLTYLSKLTLHNAISS